MELLLPATPCVPHAGLATPKAQRLRTWRDSPEWQRHARGDGGELEQAAPPSPAASPASSASGWTTGRPSELACTKTAAEAALGRLVGGGEMQSLSLGRPRPPPRRPVPVWLAARHAHQEAAPAAAALGGAAHAGGAGGLRQPAEHAALQVGAAPHVNLAAQPLLSQPACSAAQLSNPASHPVWWCQPPPRVYPPPPR